MALILSVETASPACSVAICRDGVPVGVRESSDDRSHATRLTLFIRELLDECGIQASGLSAISLSMGPGSYTGLRIGASVAKGIAYGAGLPVIGIPTLLALAGGFMTTGQEESRLTGAADSHASHDLSPLLCPMLDARRMEVYTALYDTSLKEVSAVEAMILDENSFAGILEQRPVWFFGTGSDKASAVIRHRNARFAAGLQLSAAWQALPAESLYQKGEFLDTAYFEPHYLKEFIASIPKNKVLG